MPYKALVFDFFGVVCTEVSPFWFSEYLPDGAQELKHTFLRPADRGEISQENLFSQLSNLTGIPATEIEMDWKKRANLNTELLEFIKEIKAQYRVGLLSNSMSPFFHSLADSVGILELFECVVVSSEIGHAKPEPEAFQEVALRMDLKPTECLMIDDNQVNLDGAKLVGMPGHLFTSVQELKIKLESKER